jgi:hypothetical protein
MQLIRPENPQHIESSELLPWYATGTLEPLEHTKVEQHLMECITCRNELRNIRAMQAEIASAQDADPAVGFGFARIKERIEKIESGRARSVSMRTLTAQWLASSPWIRGALFAETAMVLALASYVFLANPSPQYYRTLGATPTPATTRTKIVVVFDRAIAEGKIRDVLMGVDARIIDGPSREGAYTLEVAQERQRKILEELRRQSILAAPEPPR